MGVGTDTLELFQMKGVLHKFRPAFAMNIFLQFLIAGKLRFGTHIPLIVIHHLPEFELFTFHRDKNKSIFIFRRKSNTVLEIFPLVYS